MKTIFDFVDMNKKEENTRIKTPILLICKNCHARFSPKLIEKTGVCPKCHQSYNKKLLNSVSDIRIETPEEIENWKKI
jgi:protein-arginine kinase activator protein McsA